jgi:hypothetical protein
VCFQQLADRHRCEIPTTSLAYCADATGAKLDAKDLSESKIPEAPLSYLHPQLETASTRGTPSSGSPLFAKDK